MSAEDQPNIFWVIVETRSDNRSHPVEVWLSKTDAERSAQRMATGDSPYYSLWSIPFKGPASVVSSPRSTKDRLAEIAKIVTKLREEQTFTSLRTHHMTTQILCIATEDTSEEMQR